MEKRYSSLEGIRGWSCLLIVMAHIYLNAVYQLGSSYRKVMLLAVEMVFLYMVISGFSICCGYCTPLTNGTVTVSQFYQRRYQKIWPFWAVLVLLEVIVSPGKETFFEAFADLTLLFGLLPNASISVIGVGWFLGVVFVFYLIFPFVCFLMQTKKGHGVLLEEQLYIIYCVSGIFLIEIIRLKDITCGLIFYIA